jgi:hypothetical protein
VEADLQIQKTNLEGELGIAYAELESAQNQFQAERHRRIAELEELQSDWEEQQKHELKIHQQKMAEMKQRILDQVQAETDAEIQQQVEQAIAPYERDIATLKEHLRTLQERLIIAHEKINNYHKPIKPEMGDALSSLAWRLITFYENRGVLVDYINVFQTGNSIHVIVNPCDRFYHGEFNKKSLTKYFDALVMELKLEAPPLIGLSSNGYDLEIIPKTYQFLGMIPPVGNEPIIKQFVSELQSSNPTSEVNIVEHNFELEKMLGFIEPSRKADRDGTITQGELDWIRWLYEFREKATGQPCIKSQNDLLERVWGVTVGYSTDTEVQKDGKTLRGRLHEIMDCLGYDRPRKNQRDMEE